ncbi:hypothetical protein ACIBG7_37150 [Nonomuraea sp. NPDC050328]|uniref:hypothetical protein n=1 Tax=Nonomuraea sp. NPDC050328 TaxID=3364361 RepID=UPI003790C5D6
MAAALLLLTVAACGIAPTGVVDAGEPARGFTEGSHLYFVRDNHLVPVGRPDGPLTAAEAVNLLRAGPTDKERERALDTHLPANLPLRVDETSYTVTGGQVSQATRLPHLATGQLVCTIAAATAAQRRVPVDTVRVTVPEGGTRRCADYEQAAQSK